jgi:hypothetical protein
MALDPIGKAATDELERLKPRRTASPREEDLGPIAAEPHAFLEDMNMKEVVAYVTKVTKKKVKRFGGQPKLYLEFVITDDDYPQLDGTNLFGSCQLPPEGKDPKSYPQSKFYDWWTIANEGKPLGGERMPLKRFLGSLFQVRLHTVAKDSKQKLKPKELHYTIVEDIIGLHARGTKSW